MPVSCWPALPCRLVRRVDRSASKRPAHFGGSRSTTTVSLANLVDEYAIECGYLRRGSMSLAVSDDEMGLLIDTSDRMIEAGFSACTVPRDDLPRPFDRLYAGGIYYAGNAEINPGAFVRGVARALQPTLQIFERSPVLEIRPGDPHVLQTSNGEVRARIVIVATNAYTTRLLPAVPIAPVRGQVVATRTLDRVVVPFPMYANYGYQYWRQTADGRLVVGGWRDLDMPAEVGTDERLHDEIQDTLEGFCCADRRRRRRDRIPLVRHHGLHPRRAAARGGSAGQAGHVPGRRILRPRRLDGLYLRRARGLTGDRAEFERAVQPGSRAMARCVAPVDPPGIPRPLRQERRLASPLGGSASPGYLSLRPVSR